MRTSSVPGNFKSMQYHALIVCMKKFLHSDWLRAVQQFLVNTVQFLGNTVPKREIQCQKRKFSANFFRF